MGNVIIFRLEGIGDALSECRHLYNAHLDF